jgi:hypothetical protein
MEGYMAKKKMRNMIDKYLHSCNECCCGNEYWHPGQDDESQLPTVEERVNDARERGEHEEDEYAHLLTHALLHAVQVSEM